MLDLNKVIQKKMQELTDSGIVEKKIEESFEKMLTGVIESAFGYSSPIKKAVEKAVEDGLKVDPSKMNFETYNEQILSMIREKINTLALDRAGERFMKEIESTLKAVKKEMTMKEFVESIVEIWRGEYHPVGDWDEFATFEVDDHDGTTRTGVSIKMWSYKSGYRAVVNPDVHIYITSDGKVAVSHEHKYNPTTLCKHDAFIIKCYSSGVVITDFRDFDEDDFDLRIHGEGDC